MDEHRGRIQAQGGGVEESEPRTRPSPLLTSEALRLVDILEDRLTTIEADRRRDAFVSARRFIRNAAPRGVGPTKKSWPSPPRRDQRRADIEVQKGLAFVGDE